MDLVSIFQSSVLPVSCPVDRSQILGILFLPKLNMKINDNSLSLEGHLTPKSDVYSFGVVLLEMLSGLRAIDKNRPARQHNLVEWAKPYLTNKRRLLRVMDSRLEGQYSLNQAQKAANLALQCLANEPRVRPTMDEIVATLEQLQGSKTQKDRHSSSHRSSSSVPGSSRGSAHKGPKMAPASSYPRPSASQF